MGASLVLCIVTILGIYDATDHRIVQTHLFYRNCSSKVWSLLSVSITTSGEAAPFFTAWRVFQSKLLT